MKISPDNFKESVLYLLYMIFGILEWGFMGMMLILLAILSWHMTFWNEIFQIIYTSIAMLVFVIYSLIIYFYLKKISKKFMEAQK